MRNLFLAILVLVAIAPLSLFLYETYTTTGHVEEKPLEIPQEPSGVVVEFESSKPKILEPGVEFSVKSCKVLDGYRFFLQLEGDNAISACLSVATKDVAVSVVPDLLRESISPRVVLLRKVENDWIVRFYLTNKDGKRTDLLERLREQGLLLE